MATLIYTTGNGYNCGCCRQSTKDYQDFEVDEEIIQHYIEVSDMSEGDFHINSIKGYNGDADDLKRRITEAIEVATERVELTKKLEQIKKDIRYTENWFATLEQQKQTKQDLLDKNRATMAELEGKL